MVGYYGLALTLGGFGISPTQMAGLYAGLADDGLARPLVFSTLPQIGSMSPIGPMLLSPQARFLVLDMHSLL